METKTDVNECSGALPLLSDEGDTRERLAEYAHDAWSGWMEYLFSKSEQNEDGTVTIPKWAVERWTRQATTKYSGLPEGEKASDRDEADKMLAIMKVR